MSSIIQLVINGVQYNIDSAADSFITPKTTLAEYLRFRTTLKATKIACATGGCGACTVALTSVDPATNTKITRPINACLAPLMSLNGAAITTNEGLGSATAGYHKIQQTMAQLSATQCGYCTNGMVMLLYSYLQTNPNCSQAILEQILDGNLCRCTGYRPILDAFKTFATPSNATSQCQQEDCCQKRKKFGELDMEDSAILVSKPQKQFHVHRKVTHGLSTAGSVAIWQDVTTLTDLQYWMNHFAGMKVMLCVGGTSNGIFPQDYDVYLNIATIPELNVITQTSTSVTYGGAVVLDDMINSFWQLASNKSYQTKHFATAVNMLYRAAGVAIRMKGSIAGNLVMCKQSSTTPKDMFPSDVAIMLMGLEATVQMLNAKDGTTTTYSMVNFFRTLNLTNLVVVAITIPFAQSDAEVYRVYKIAQRQAMSHAIVNASMKVTVQGGKIIGAPVVAFGGILAHPDRVDAFEKLLVGTQVNDITTFKQLALQLQKVLSGAIVPGSGKTAFRVLVAVNYLFKFFLALQPNQDPAYTLAAQQWMSRPVTSATQTFDTDPVEYPVSLSIPKVDGLMQCAGETKYTTDNRLPAGCVFATVVQATQGNCDIASIDPTVCNSVAGFVKFLSATDMPVNQNQYQCGNFFCTGHVGYAGQIVGAVVATSLEVAKHCASLITASITYKNKGTLILTVDDAVAAKSFFPADTNPPPVARDAANIDTIIKTAKYSQSGSVYVGKQYHFYLENCSALVQEIEGLYQIEVGTQAPAFAQMLVSTALGLPSSNVLLKSRRCGGAFGGKITNTSITAAIAAFSCQQVGCPVLMEIPFAEGMKAFGSRPEYRADYSIAFDENNMIQAMKVQVYLACGWSSGDSGDEAGKVAHNIDNCYNIPHFYASVVTCQTHTPPITAVRGPGWIQDIMMCEMMFNAASQQMNVDPALFRQKNFYVPGNTAPDGMPMSQCQIGNIWKQLMQSADYTTRVAAVQQFNQQNKFVKRGISINPIRFSVDWATANFNCTVSIYNDGSIGITNGGCELGQGLNTKVMQCAAYKLGLTEQEMYQYIKIYPTTTRIAPNISNITGGSVGSELASFSVMQACDKLNARLAPLKKPGQSWADLCSTAMSQQVDMMAEAWSDVPPSAPYSQYNTWGAAVGEVEVDCLTGQFEIVRCDLLYDCGVSMNPNLDIGQVEGGFMMGLGWFTCEEAKFDPSTGQLATSGAWGYKPPSAYEIPEVFNVGLLKNSTNKLGVLSSKAVGEPPQALASCIIIALSNAIQASRNQTAPGGQPFNVTRVPMTVDSIANGCGVAPQSYTF